jgi:hypothetical protein
VHGATTRSTGATVPALAHTTCLIGLFARRTSADSAAIEDIPSSMQPKETHHERHQANPLQLRRLSGHRLPLRLPASCCASSRTAQLRLWFAVHLLPELHLHEALSRVVSELALAAAKRPRPAPCSQRSI